MRAPVSPDVAIIGAGIVGCAAAAFLAEAGASVVVFERDAVAAGASGRNQGIVQRPFDPALVPLFDATVDAYRALSGMELGFRLPDAPAGLLLVGRDHGLVSAEADALMRDSPALEPVLIQPQDLRSLEPALAPGLAACLIQTGYVIPPAAATEGFARLARDRGVRFEVGDYRRPWLREGRVAGIEGSRTPRHVAGAVVIAAGAWSRQAMPARAGQPVPIHPLWGVIATVHLVTPPRHPVEEIGVDVFVASANRKTMAVPSSFSLVTTGDGSAVGATGLAQPPDERIVAPVLLERGAAFVPELGAAAILATRACPRPVCVDGRPLVGAVPGIDGLYIAAGHGPWGISTGPGSARLLTDAILGSVSSIAAELSPERFRLA